MSIWWSFLWVLILLLSILFALVNFGGGNYVAASVMFLACLVCIQGIRRG